MSVFLQLNGLSKCITPLPVQPRKRFKVLKVTVVLACSIYTNLASLMKCFGWTFQRYYRDKSLDDWNSMIVFLICPIQTKVFSIQPCSYYSHLRLLFSFAIKTNLKLLSAFQIRIWRNPTVASKDFHQNCAALCAAKLCDNLKIVVVLPCLFILG